MRPRNGLPHAARLVRERRPIAIAAFGTSMTHDGVYLTRVGARFAALGAPVSLARVGLRFAGASVAVHHLDRFLALPTDLAIVEFAINDGLLAGNVVAETVEAMHAIVGRIHDAHPYADIAIVAFRHPDAGARGEAAVAAHEAIAAYYGLPSFNLGHLAEQLVAGGRAMWTSGRRALTTDGVHLAPAAAALVGGPFADALATVVRDTARGEPRPFAAVPDSLFARARRVPVRALDATGWTFAPPSGSLVAHAHTVAFADEVATAQAPGAALRFAFVGSRVVLWVATGGGAFRIRVDGKERTIPLPAEPAPRFVDVTLPLAEGRHELELTVTTAPLTLGDVLYVGERLPSA